MVGYYIARCCMAHDCTVSYGMVGCCIVHCYIAHGRMAAGCCMICCCVPPGCMGNLSDRTHPLSYDQTHLVSFAWNELSI